MSHILHFPKIIVLLLCLIPAFMYMLPQSAIADDSTIPSETEVTSEENGLINQFGGIRNVFCADFNGDGWLDLFAGSYHGGKDRDVNSFLSGTEKASSVTSTMYTAPSEHSVQFPVLAVHLPTESSPAAVFLLTGVSTISTLFSTSSAVLKSRKLCVTNTVKWQRI